MPCSSPTQTRLHSNCNVADPFGPFSTVLSSSLPRRLPENPHFPYRHIAVFRRVTVTRLLALAVGEIGITSEWRFSVKVLTVDDWPAW